MDHQDSLEAALSPATADRPSTEVERSMHYSASLSSMSDGETPDRGTRNGSFVTSMYDSFLPTRNPLQQVAVPEIPVGQSLDIDLAMGLQPQPGPELAHLTHQSTSTPGYLSDSHLPRNSASTEHLYQPPGERGRTRHRRAGPALRNALANQGTVAPGQPGRVRRVNKVLTMHLRDQGSDDVRIPSIAQPC